MSCGFLGPDDANFPTTPSQTIAERIERLVVSREHHIYRDVRDRVLAIKDADMARHGSPSDYWQTELRWFEYMLDAGPLVIESLRWHTHHITGLEAYDYRDNRDPKRLTARLDALHRRAVEGPDVDLFVPEHPALGGFGFRDVEGHMFNVDTLKGFETLIALSVMSRDMCLMCLGSLVSVSGAWPSAGLFVLVAPVGIVWLDEVG